MKIDEYRRLSKKKNRKRNRVGGSRKNGLGKTFEQERDEWIRRQLRRIHLLWPQKDTALRAARVGRNLYLCAHCKKIFNSELKQIDHINPCAGNGDFISLDRYCHLLFVREDGYQVLCVYCHQIKTTKEAALRSELARERIDLFKSLPAFNFKFFFPLPRQVYGDQLRETFIGPLAVACVNVLMKQGFDLTNWIDHNVVPRVI